MYEFIKFEKENGVATLTLNRPDVYNALNDEITFEIQAALKEAKRDQEVRVLVLTGEGKGLQSTQIVLFQIHYTKDTIQLSRQLLKCLNL